jgi:hypothetical protein
MLYSGPKGVAYGVSNAPTLPGSGGAYYGAIGGRGGGLVWVVTPGWVTLGGTITANGEDAQPHAGAGSGGGIYLQCDTLAGDASGWLYAKGGVAVGANPGGGSGGGGRIAVDCRWLRWRYTNQVDVSGGTNSAFAYQIGQPGTVYWNITGPHGSSFVIR